MGPNANWRELELLYRESFPRFERVARAITGERELAREAVQDGFADALRAADRYEGRGPLEAWVWRCVVNRARKARRPPLELLAEPPEIHDRDDNGIRHGERPEVRARIAALPERQRLAIFLRYYADLDYASIATVLEVEPGTVSATLSQAHHNLRAAIVKEER